MIKRALTILLALALPLFGATEPLLRDTKTGQIRNTGTVNFAIGQILIDGQPVSPGGGGPGGGSPLSSLSLSVPSVLFSPSTVSFSLADPANPSGTMLMATQPANTFFGNPTGSSATPIFFDPTTARQILAVDNTNNTSDADKPVSIAQASAIAAANAAFTGTSNIVTLGTISSGVWQGTILGNSYIPTLDAIRTPVGDLSIGGFKLTNVGAPLGPNDGTNKAYVDAVAVTGPPHVAVAAATTANIASLSGEQTIDGVLTSASRVLVKNQSTASQNGIYVTSSGSWTRATDSDAGTEIPGNIFVTGGTNNGNTQWGAITPQPITVGSTAITYTITGASNSYTAAVNGGLLLSGSQFSIASNGVLTAMINNGAVTYAKIQNVAANKLLGNPTASAAAPSEISIGTGLSFSPATSTLNNTNTGTVSSVQAGSGLSPLFTISSVSNATTTPALNFSLTNSAAHTVFGNSSNATGAPTYFLLNDSQVGTDSDNIWANGKTAFYEGTALTVSRIRTLPSTASYGEGQPIFLSDGKTTQNFGPLVVPATGDTLNGLTPSAWINLGYYQPYKVGGDSGHTKMVMFQKQGTNWQAIGDTVSAYQVQSQLNPLQKVILDPSLQTAGVNGNVTFANGQSYTYNATDTSVKGLLIDAGNNGTFTKDKIGINTGTKPTTFTIGSSGTDITGTSFTVNDTPGGTIDTVIIQGRIVNPITVVWPLASAFQPWQKIEIRDASGTAASSHPVTIVSAAGDTFNTQTSFTFDEANGSKTLASDHVSNWSVSLTKATNKPFTVLSGPNIVINADPNAVKENDHINLVGGVNNITINNPYDGMPIELYLVQPASGGPATVNLPIVSGVGANGVGLVGLSSTANVIDKIKGNYDGAINQFMWDPPVLNYSTSALPAAPDTLANGTITASKVPLTWVDHASNENGFTVERADGLGATTGFAPLVPNAPAVASTGGTGSLDDSSVSPNTDYTYRVKAFNSAGYSAPSATLDAHTASGGATADLWEIHFNENSGVDPTTVVPSGVGAKLTYADWTTSTPGAASAAAYNPVAGMAASSYTGPIVNVNAGGTTYTYRVYAYKSSNGLHNFATNITTTTGNATLSGSNTNTISWNDVAGADYYVVYRTAATGTGANTPTGPSSNTGKISANIPFGTTTFVDNGITGTGTIPGQTQTDVHTATAKAAINYAQFNAGQTLTINFWVKSTFTAVSGGGSVNIIDLGNAAIRCLNASGTPKLNISMSGTTGVQTVNVPLNVTIDGTSMVSGTDWHMITVELDNTQSTNANTNIKVWFNGSTHPQTTTNSQTSRVGPASFPSSAPVVGSSTWSGAIDDVRIYSTLINNSAIDALYGGGNGAQ